MSTVFSLICLGRSFQKMVHHFLLHGSLWPTNLEKKSEALVLELIEAQMKIQTYHGPFVIYLLFVTPYKSVSFPFPAVHNNCCLLSHLLMYFDSLHYKQYGPRQTTQTDYSDRLLWVQGKGFLECI